MILSISKIKYFINIFLVSIFIFVSALAYIPNGKLIKYRSFIIILVIALFLINNRKVLNKTINKKLIFILWIIMSCFISISSIVIDKNFLEPILYLVFIPIFYFKILNNIGIENNYFFIIRCLIYGTSPYILDSIIKYPNIFTNRYKGVFENSNSMGMIASFLGICLIIKLIEDKRSIINILEFLLLIIVVTMTLASTSRTSIISFSISIIIYTVYKFKNRRIFNIKILATVYLILLFISFIVLIKINVKDMSNIFNFDNIVHLIDSFREKNSTLEGNIFNGREYIWRSTLNDIALMGHGENYFYNKFELGAHNTIISFLGRYGILAGLALISIFVVSAISSIRFLIKTKDIVPSIIIIYYIMVCMTESLMSPLGKPINILFLYFIAYINNNYILCFKGDKN